MRHQRGVHCSVFQEVGASLPVSSQTAFDLCSGVRFFPGQQTTCRLDGAGMLGRPQVAGAQRGCGTSSGCVHEAQRRLTQFSVPDVSVAGWSSC